MSARSSSGSWSGGGVAPPDIIDLDKFMRGAVRPSRPEILREPLVVDAGGVDRKSAAPSAPAAPVSGSPPSSSSGSRGRPPPHGKRFSHDSGLSDGSYARRRHRPHKRAVGEHGGRMPRTPAGSSNSLRAFREVCERALLDQQAQIARVAQLCERLNERAPRRRSTPDTSDVSSSSRSTRDPRGKDKHRAEECKTYKIIMNKLDELNRMFAARARSPETLPAHATHGGHAAPRRGTPSSGSVSVSDKVVATEPTPASQLAAASDALRAPVQVNHNSVTVRGGGAGGESAGGRGSAGAGSTRLSALRAVTNTCALDIAPRDAMPTLHRHNIATESVMQGESQSCTGSSAGDPRCGFDLEDPMHRLQALPATTRRALSVDRDRLDRLDRFERFDERRVEERLQRFEERFGERRHARLVEQSAARERSLCALCRGYWRALRQYLAAQIFCQPDTACQ